MSRVQWQEAQLPPPQELHPELALASSELSDSDAVPMEANVLKSFETLRELHRGQRVLSL